MEKSTNMGVYRFWVRDKKKETFRAALIDRFCNCRKDLASCRFVVNSQTKRFRFVNKVGIMGVVVFKVRGCGEVVFHYELHYAYQRRARGNSAYPIVGTLFRIWGN